MNLHRNNNVYNSEKLLSKLFCFLIINNNMQQEIIIIGINKLLWGDIFDKIIIRNYYFIMDEHIHYTFHS